MEKNYSSDLRNSPDYMQFRPEYVEWLKNDPKYGGCSVVLGLPAHFRELKDDAGSDPVLIRRVAQRGLSKYGVCASSELSIFK